MNINIITSCLYVTVKKTRDAYTFNDGIFKEVENLNKILVHTRDSEIITKPPVLHLYVILIPGEKVNNTLNDTPRVNINELYETTGAPNKIGKLLHGILERTIDSKLIPNIPGRFQYKAYSIQSENEYAFMDGLESAGSFLDIVKAYTIISNRGQNNLHMDSNTDIIDKNNLYLNTFERRAEELGLNCDNYGLSRCSTVYIAFHNKILYVHNNSILPEVLGWNLNDFFKLNKNNAALKRANVNAIYDYVWCNTTYDIACTHMVETPDSRNPGKMFKFYPAAVLDPRYGLNKYYITVQRESWRIGREMETLTPINLTLYLPDKTRINEWSIRSLFRIYKNFPDLEDVETQRIYHMLYPNSDSIDYVTFLNKQPNETNMEILKAVAPTVVGVSGCYNQFTTPPVKEFDTPVIDPVANDIRCRIANLPKTGMFQGMVGGGPEELNPLYESYDYELDSSWKPIVGGKSRKQRKKKEKRKTRSN